MFKTYYLVFRNLLYKKEIFLFIPSKTSGRLTWEEWYLKKRIESLKNEKKLQEKMHKVTDFLIA